MPEKPIFSKLQITSKEDWGMVKGEEIAKIISKPKTKQGNFDLEVISVEKTNKGVVCLVKAWDKDGNQVGFGEDGTVEIERIFIVNPPIQARTGNKIIVPFFNRAENREMDIEVDEFVENPEMALLQSLEHIVQIIGKSGGKIQIGKVGKTTTTVYPQSGTGGTTCDGELIGVAPGSSAIWSTVRGDAGDAASPSLAQIVMAGVDASTTADQFIQMWRSIYTLDTSSIPDTDVISSAVFSLYDSNNQAQTFSTSPTYVVVASTPAANNNLVAADFAQLGSTAYSDYVSFTVSQYNNFTFNATGISNVSKTGITKIGVRTNWDADNSAPTWGSGNRSYRYVQAADTTGTSQDPVLVITHAEAALSSAPILNLSLMGVG